MSFPTLRRTTRVLQFLVVTVAPHGGQATARRNAWASMSADAVRARGRREAALAIERSMARALAAEAAVASG